MILFSCHLQHVSINCAISIVKECFRTSQIHITYTAHCTYPLSPSCHKITPKSRKVWSLVIFVYVLCNWIEPHRDKTNKMACAPSEDSDQPGHPPSLIRVFAIRLKKAWILSYPLSTQWRLWSDWADAQVDLSLGWAHNHIVGFVMRRLICSLVVL